MRQRSYRRARTLPGAIGVTGLSAFLPGAGYLFNRRHVLGAAVLLLAFAGVIGATLYLPTNLHDAIEFAVDPVRLKTAIIVFFVVLAAWTAVVVSTYVMVHPKEASAWQKWLGGAFVFVLCGSVAAPTAIAAHIAMTEADVVNTVFTHNETATIPKDVTPDDPWGGRKRVSVLLLGGDGGPKREGVRTDSMILVSINTRTGKAVSFSLPRNMMYAQFPKSSPLHDVYPNGFTGEGDAGNWMLNAVYREVPLLNPGILGDSHNEGADAIKQAIQGTTGLRVDYYALINLEGFQQLIDAMGGVTVNINVPIAIGGNTDLGIPPDEYLQPGPDQHLDGWYALWYTRGRYGSDDYQRMDRQRCMIDAIANQASPLNLLKRYQALAAAGKKLNSTDIPRELLPDFVDLALKMKDKKLKSVVFVRSDDFDPGNPDFAYVHKTVRKALKPGHKHHHNPSGESNADACAYNPVE